MNILTATREQLIQAWNDNTNEMVDAFIAADVDPDKAETPTEAIRAVIHAWVEAGDECEAV